MTPGSAPVTAAPAGPGTVPKRAEPRVPDVTDVDGVARAAGGIETATVAYVDTLALAAGDPKAILAQLAVQLARAVDEAGAVPAAVRELRVLLGQLAEIPGQAGGPVDELRARRSQRRLDQILGALPSAG